MPSSPGPTEQAPPVESHPPALAALHTTCPPESHASPMSGVESTSSSTTEDELSAEMAHGSIQEIEGVDPEARPRADTEEPVMRDSPSPVIAQEPAEHDSRPAQPHSSTSTSPKSASEWPLYTGLPKRVFPNSSSSCLRPGSKFVGTQQSDRQVYNVQVELKYVDMEESFLCGYLRIQGLTDDHPTLTTYFEGEIIGNRHTFKTAHPEWGSSEKVDMQHWNRFPAWRPLSKQAKTPGFSFKNFAQREHLFMRWKEYFLVPDHKVKTISGASFEGFYYICFNQCSGAVSGIYFHAKSEKYQQLELEHVNDRGCMAAIEFR